MMRLWLLILTAPLFISVQSWAQNVDAALLSRIEQATVFITQVDNETLDIRCVGSGVFVRPDGVILTNAHHTVQSSICPGDTLIVSLNLEPNKPPVPKYRARVVASDDGLDIALLRIDAEFDGRAIAPGSLPLLPFVELADAASLSLDETVTFVGYRDVANTGVASIRGSVRGFIAEPRGGEQSWLKTASVVPVPGVMTGGGLYNDDGLLVGIPTSAPTVLQSLGSQCLRIQDVNRDGVVNDLDPCVPIGDNISVVRPIEFARPLIRGASLGLTVDSLTIPRFQTSVAGRPRISRVFSSPSVVDGIPSTVVASLPAGTTSHYLFFDYENMTPETVFEMRVTVDGVPNDVFSLPPVRWSGRDRGLWYVGSSGQPYPNGRYEFRIFVDGVAAASYVLVIGGPALQSPAFSNIVFGLLEPDGQLAGNGYVLPTGTIATARFIFSNMQPDLTYTTIWYYNYREIARTTANWSLQKGANGTDSVNLQPEGGLPTGVYRVELYIGSALSSTGDFVIAGAAQQSARPNVFSNLEFIRSNTNALPADPRPANSFPDGANTLFFRFDWEQIAVGTSWRLDWLVDNTVFYSLDAPWNTAETGANFTLRLSAAGGIPDGNYTVRLYVNNVLLQSASVSVGIGQLRVDRLATGVGIPLRGRIYDVESGRGIPGVTFILITEDFSIADFTWSQDQIYALAVTDQNGEFIVDRLLQLRSPYSVIISAAGYLTLAVDGFLLREDSPNPLIMNIPLTRD
ncbi:trypsin-like peptidase domain-containing protein [Aggregatilineales bacterium SYSU G02658]